MKTNLVLRPLLLAGLILATVVIMIAPNSAAPGGNARRQDASAVPGASSEDLAAGAATVTPSATPNPVAGDPFGSYFVFSGQQLLGGQQIAAAGATWAQFHIQWTDIEQQPGVYNWATLDARMNNAATLGLKSIVTVNGNPPWAAEVRCGPIYPEHLVTFANFLQAAVARYSVAPYHVLHWALYNEADNGDPINNMWLGGCWGASHPNHAANAGGAAYAAMLKVVYPAMKAANPNVQVLLSGLAYDWFTPKGHFDPEFVNDIMAAGGGPYFDALNFHYFHAWQKSWTTADRYNTGLPRKAQRLRQAVAAYGFVKPLIITELGHPYGAQDAEENAKLSEDVSARLVWQLNAQAMSAGIYPIIWFEAVDEPWLPYLHGLLYADLTPNLTHAAFRALTTELTGARFSTVRRDYESDVMGYDFVVGDQTKTVVWVTTQTQKEQTFPLPVAGETLRVMDKFGTSQMIVDGSAGDLDGLRNGSVRILIDADPRLVVVPFLAPTLTPTPTPTPTRAATRTPTPTVTPRASSTPPVSAKTRSYQNGSAPKASYTGATDAFVSEQQAGTNFGAITPLVISGNDPTGSNKDKWALMRWVLSPTSGIMQSASVTFNVNDHSGGQVYDLVEALANWGETSVTWNAKPAAGTTVLGTASPAKIGLVTITLNGDGIAVLQKWLNAPKKNYGFYLLKSSATDTLRLDAREAATASLRPKLTITFVPPSLSKAPWVQNLGKTTATVFWETDTFAVSTFKYRKQGLTTWTTKKATTTLVSGKWQAKVALSGLVALTTYEYQVRASADSPWTNVLNFKTLAAAPSLSDPAAAAPDGVGEAPIEISIPTGYALLMPDRLQGEAGQPIQAPVWVKPGSGDVSGLAFTLVYDPDWLVFDRTDADEDGAPDAVSFHLDGDFGVEIGVEEDDGGGGQIRIRLSDVQGDTLAEVEGPLLHVAFVAAASPGQTTRLEFGPGATLFDAAGGSHPMPALIAGEGGAPRFDSGRELPGDPSQPLTLFMPRLLN